jgi:hypothetical protein
MNVWMGCVSRRYLTLRVSGSENAPDPAKTSLQGLQEVCPSVTPQRRSALRLRSTPSHEVPGLSRRFLRHMLSTVSTLVRPSGLEQGTNQRSRLSRTSLTSSAVHVRAPYTTSVPFR